jgi:hypothetical protein
MCLTDQCGILDEYQCVYWKQKENAEHIATLNATAEQWVTLRANVAVGQCKYF